MTGCEREAIDGNCGLDCSVYLKGQCDCATDMIIGATPKEKKAHKKIYGGSDE